ncbi:GlcG/HbpS family heme-binding protein [Aminobacter sp. Piv2-1]|uniref:GlcG/HbpS family heme-binding protein n=1 Tax=Aminobacter sp. Piv2-1 TaxID=3031122 RepID=UPI0030B5075E
MTELTLAKANAIIATALELGAQKGFKPLGVAVLDAGGHLLAFQRQDGSPFIRAEVASGKAYGALAVGSSSRALGVAAVERPHFFQGLSAVSGGKIVPVPGGVLIRDRDGNVLGAVGISGDTSDNDELAAMAGIEAAGFVAKV